MKRIIASITIGLALMTADAFAGNGDLIVDGKLGVGVDTTATAGKFHVVGSGSLPSIVADKTYGASGDSASCAKFSLNGDSSGLYLFGYGGNSNIAHNQEYISGTGYVARQTSTSSIDMSYTGFRFYSDSGLTVGNAYQPTFRFGISNTGTRTVDVNGDVYSNGILLTSDERYKKNIAPVQNAIATLSRMEGVSYEWKKPEEYRDVRTLAIPPVESIASTDLFPGQKRVLGVKNFSAGRHYGVLAQAIEKVLPEVVSTDANGEKAVAYTEIIPVLIEAIKEQQKMIEKLQVEVGAMKRFSAASN